MKQILQEFYDFWGEVWNKIEKVYSSLTEIILAQILWEKTLPALFWHLQCVSTQMGEVIVSNSGKVSVRDSSHCNLPQSISESLQVSSSPDKKG